VRVKASIEEKNQSERLAPAPTLTLIFCSGDNQYLEHLLTLLEVLEPILQNDNED
jgi:hypothetical protein